MMETIKFKSDSATRRRFFTPESFQHPAKMASGLVLECIERYTKPGDLVLDPMAGSGTTLLAALMGRNVICVELEQHFVDPMRQSWEKMRQHPMLGHEMGQAVILRGDARCLPLPDASVGAAITSPPYEAMDITQPLVGTTQGNATHKDGLQRRYTRPVDAIVTSPPFQETTAQLGEFKTPNDRTSLERRLWRETGGYTRPVDAIVTSPPYQMENPGLESGSHPVERDYNHNIRYSERQSENIGNMKGSQYFEAMRLVYQECFRVLKPRGIMALVLKGFTRDGLYVDLPGQTEALLLEAGWVKHNHWRRELWSLSFWRILQKRRDPAAFDDRLKFEEVLVFRKPGGEGTGVDAVITPPPYENLSFSGDTSESQARAEAHFGRKFGPGQNPSGYTHKERP